MLESVREFARSASNRRNATGFYTGCSSVPTQLAAGLNLRPEATERPGIEAAQRERPNVDVALDWAVASGEVAGGLRLVVENSRCTG